MKRIFLDCLLIIIFLLIMSFHFLPKLWHEILGLVMPILALLHVAWNRQWFAALLRGKYSLARFVPTTINLLLIVSLVVVAVTGILVSHHIFKGIVPLTLQRNITVHQLHNAASYFMLILVGLHLGFHWQSWWERLLQKVKWNRSSRLYRYGCRCAAVFLVSVGCYASFLDRVGDRLLMRHVFGTEAVKQSFPMFLLLLTSVVALYAVIGFYARRLLANRITGARATEKK